MPNAGAAPRLAAYAQGTQITIKSRSPSPVSISISDGYGTPFRYWRSLKPGDLLSATVITKRSYGYCFAQAADAGYAATRACGRLITWSYLNGVETPGGEPIAETVAFARR